MRPSDKAFLVGANGQADDLGRNGEKILFELAYQHDRPFDQVGDLFQQAFVLDEVEAVGKGDVAGIGEDDLLAAVGIEHDLGRLELGRVVVEAAYGDRAWGVEAVAIGDVAGADAVDLEIDHHRLLGLRAEGAQDRLQRPHPAQRAGLGRSRPPAHRCRPGEAADDGRHQFGDDRFRGPARL